jgi:hypothetical protein
LQPFGGGEELPKSRFAALDTTRYTLSDGEDWVEFRNTLTWGERMKLAGDTSIVEAGEARVNWGVYQARRLLAYLKKWSFVMPDKQPAPITADWVEGLDAATGEELDDLLTKHLIAQDALKNSPA